MPLFEKCPAAVDGCVPPLPLSACKSGRAPKLRVEVAVWCPLLFIGSISSWLAAVISPNFSFRRAYSSSRPAPLQHHSASPSKLDVSRALSRKRICVSRLHSSRQPWLLRASAGHPVARLQTTPARPRDREVPPAPPRPTARRATVRATEGERPWGLRWGSRRLRLLRPPGAPRPGAASVHRNDADRDGHAQDVKVSAVTNCAFARLHRSFRIS